MTSLSQDEEERNASKFQVIKVLGIGSESGGVEWRWSKWGGGAVLYRRRTAGPSVRLAELRSELFPATGR